MIRFPMIVGIVFIHSQNKGLFSSVWGGQISDIPIYMFFQNIISQGMCRACVPLFLLISGYLFFGNSEWNKDTYIAKIKRRINTLFIPYILYIVIALFIFGIMQRLMPSLISEGKTPIADYGIKEYLEAFWMYNGESIPFVGPLWFLRDLMILCLLSPLIYLFVRYLKLWGLAVVLGMYLMKVPYTGDLFYFSVGAWFALNNIDFGELFSKWKIVRLIYPLLLIADVFTKQYSFNYVLNEVGVIFGIVFFVGLSWLMVKNRGNFMPTILSSATFFVYAAHEPYFDQVRKVVFKVLSMPQNPVVADIEMVFLYFLLPSVFIVLLVLLYHCIAKVSPLAASVLSGNRK